MKTRLPIAAEWKVARGSQLEFVEGLLEAGQGIVVAGEESSFVCVRVRFVEEGPRDMLAVLRRGLKTVSP